MGIDHDRIHFETSSVLIRQYKISDLIKPEGWEYAPISEHINKLEFIDVPGGTVCYGKPHTYPYFGWDNEYGFAVQHLDSFSVSRTLISNGNFLDFVNDGGYENINYWSEGGLKWKRENGVNYPKFWVKQDNIYRYRAMYDEIDMPSSWPVEVNYYEAEAYCDWFGENAKIMSEAQYEMMAQKFGPKTEAFLEENYNLNIKFGSPTPVNFFQVSEVYDVYGNVFQWLSTPFHPLPSFTTHYLYSNFSFPYFDEDHYMLKGGSWASTGASSSKYYRLWFRKHFFQHAGFRVCISK